MKEKLTIAFVLITLLITPIVLASLATGDWTENLETEITITEGESAEFEFRIQALSGTPYTVILFDDSEQELHTFAEGITRANFARGTETVLPSHYQTPGSYYVHIWVGDDGYGPDVQILDLTVREEGQTNNPPNLEDPDDVTVTENDLVTIDIYASDIDLDTLDYSTDALFGSLRKISNEHAQFTWQTTIGDKGIYLVTFTVDDGNNGTDSETVRITVNEFIQPNRPPTLNKDIEDQEWNEDTSTTIDLDDYFSDPDFDTLEYSATPVQNIDINIVGSIATLTPDANFNYVENGLRYTTFTADDGQYKTNSNVVTLKVLPVNDAPVITNIPGETVQAPERFATFDLDDFVSDVDHNDNQLDWEVSGNTELDVQISNSHIVTIIYPNGFTGSETLTFTVTNPEDASDSDTATFTVTEEDNNPPVFDGPIPPIEWNEDTSTTIDLDDYFSDPDQDPLIYTATPTANIDIDVFGSIATLTPDVNFNYVENGLRFTTFTADDGEYKVNSNIVELKVLPVNDAPVITNIPGQTVQAPTEFATFDLDDFVSDIDHNDNELEWEVTGNTELDVEISRFNVVTITYQEGFSGSEVLTFTVTDPEEASDSDTATFTVTEEANQPPEFNSPIPEQEWNEDTATTLDLDDYFSDPDHDPLIYTATPVQNIDIDIQDNIATLTPDANFNYELNGLRYTTFTADDGQYKTNSNIVTLKVLPVNDAPTADFTWDPQNPEVNEPISFDGSLSSDIDGDTLTYEWDFDDDGEPDAFTEKPTHTYTEPGQYPVTLNVSDGELWDESIQIVFVGGELEITSIECFDILVEGFNQSCSVYVEANNVPLGEADVDVYYTVEGNPTYLGSCTTNNISGGCSVKNEINITGNFTAYAEAHKLGYTPDTDKDPDFDFQVISHRYDIENLKLFNDSQFTQEDYDYFRGEPFWASFSVRDKLTGFLVDDIVTEVELVSDPGGRIDLEEITGLQQPGFYYYELEMIPLTHDFLGESHTFAFAINFTDMSGGQQEVALIIRNNPPVILEPIPDITIEDNEVFIFDLTQYESDLEDGPAADNNHLTWQITHSGNYFDAEINTNDQLSLTPIAVGSEQVTLTLSDWDKDTDDTTITITITQEALNQPPVATILNPFNGQTFTDIDLIDFIGQVIDPEQGELSGNDVWWESDIDGFIGYGTTQTTTLSIGQHTITLTGQDNYTLRGTDTITLNIEEFVPAIIADAGGPYKGRKGDTLTIDGSGSTGNITLYSWDFGDGTQLNSTLPIVEHAYTHLGIYTVTLTVYDELWFSHTDTTTASIDAQKACSDGLDNDGDGYTDMEDPGCTYPGDPSEQNLNTFAEEGLKISKVSIYGHDWQYVRIGDSLVVQAQFENNGHDDLDSLRMTVMIPELGIKRNSGLFDLHPGDRTSKDLIIDIPYYAWEDEFNVNIQVTNDDLRRSMWRYVIVE